MRWILFACGLVLGALGALAFFIYVHNEKEANDDILFAQKIFFDEGDVTLAVSGTLTGKGLAYRNNTYGITCRKEQGECWITYIEQIGRNQIGRIENPYAIPITRWNTYEVIASEEVYDWTCSKTTITISRKTQTVLWVEEPINHTRPSCTHASTEIHKYTIEDNPGWKRIDEAAKKAAAK